MKKRKLDFEDNTGEKEIRWEQRIGSLLSGTSGLSFHHWASTLCLQTLFSTSIFILEIQSIPHFVCVCVCVADSIFANSPNSCPLSQWYHPTLSSSVTPFSSYPQSFPASECFSMSQLFISHGQSIGALASVLPINIQSWFPLGLTGLISLLSKGLSRDFYTTTVWKHQFLGA